MLVSGVQQSGLVLYVYIHIFINLFSIVGYYKILNTIPCVTQHICVAYLFNLQQFVLVNPVLPAYPPPRSDGHEFSASVCLSLPRM